jgi:hypothetical protein
VTLAEEISFANGFIGEGSVEGCGWESQTKSREEADEELTDMAH